MLDLDKAFDSVDREMASQILLSRGAPPKLVALIRGTQLQVDNRLTLLADLPLDIAQNISHI
ncbi:TPA: hypothetical protein ACH3X1_015025 [Trebouxia sp. C0004]